MKKLFKRAFCMVMAVLMAILVIQAKHFAVTASASSYVTGDIITYGSYPQTNVTDSALITNLNACTPDADNNATNAGEKYKKVYFTQYTPYYATAAPDADHSYQDDNGYYTETVYWFKYEPIQWRVLSNTNGELFVMAEKILDSRAYTQALTPVTWETSDLRAWLNNNFYDTAFTADEKVRIETSLVVNDDHPVYHTEGGNDTNDKVYLLSYNEAINTAYGFNSSYSKADTARQAQGTDFAKSSGIFVYTASPCTGNSGWWLRSPGNGSEYAASGNGYGNIYNFFYAMKAYVGVRPVMKLSPEPISLKPTAASTCVIDKQRGYIYGLQAGLTKTIFESKYVSLTGEAKLVYTPDTENLGTGTKVDLVDNATNSVLESYKIIIFGDVNGDSNIDSIDAGLIVDVENYLVVWDKTADAALYFAGDVNGDGNSDTIDAGVAVDVQNYLMSIDQATGLSTQI